MAMRVIMAIISIKDIVAISAIMAIMYIRPIRAIREISWGYYKHSTIIFVQYNLNLKKYQH